LGFSRAIKQAQKPWISANGVVGLTFLAIFLAPLWLLAFAFLPVPCILILTRSQWAKPRTVDRDGAKGESTKTVRFNPYHSAALTLVIPLAMVQVFTTNWFYWLLNGLLVVLLLLGYTHRRIHATRQSLGLATAILIVFLANFYTILYSLLRCVIP